MDYKELQVFLDEDLGRWGDIRKTFANVESISAFLKESYVVVTLDSYQLNVDFVRALDTKKKKADEERLREEMAAYFESGVREIALEVRFSSVCIDFIMEIKTHPLIRHLNPQTRESIRVVVHGVKVR